LSFLLLLLFFLFWTILPHQASIAMLVRFSVTINDAFQSTGGAIMNKTVAMALTNKNAYLARVPAQNSGKTRRVVFTKIDTIFLT